MVLIGCGDMSRRRSIETIEQSQYVTIGELARLTGVRYSSLKYYTEEKLLPFDQDDMGLTRRYNRIHSIKRIDEIKALRGEGKTIEEIKNILYRKEGS